MFWASRRRRNELLALGLGDWGALAAAAANLEAAIAELFQGGRMEALAPAGEGLPSLLPLLLKLSDRFVERSKVGVTGMCGATHPKAASLALVAARRGGFGGGTTEGTAAEEEEGQLVEFSEPLSLIVSELMLFLRWAFGVALPALEDPDPDPPGAAAF